MFIFKKRGNIGLNNNLDEALLSSNLIKFTPVFKIGRGGENRYGHTAPFPPKLPLLSVTTFTNKGDIVLDPFLGSGTSAIVSAKNGRTGIGIELNEDYLNLCKKRIEEEDLKWELIG